MTVKLTLMNSFKRIDFPSKKKKSKQNKNSSVLFTKIAKTPRENSADHQKRGERKEGREERMRRRRQKEIQSIFVCPG